jgi:hypothetical protein
VEAQSRFSQLRSSVTEFVRKSSRAHIALAAP